MEKKKKHEENDHSLRDFRRASSKVTDKSWESSKEKGVKRLFKGIMTENSQI